MTDSNFMAEIRAALAKFDTARREGRESFCVTLAMEANRRVWVQLMGEQVNIGLYDDEDASRITQSIKKHGLQTAEAGYEQGVYVDIQLKGQRGEGFVSFLHDVLIRHQRGRACSLQVACEDL